MMMMLGNHQHYSIVLVLLVFTIIHCLNVVEAVSGGSLRGQEQDKHRELSATSADDFKIPNDATVWRQVIKEKNQHLPHPLQVFNQSVIKHQFLHLHHMKTGGTSMDHLLGCAVRRLSSVVSNGHSNKISKAGIHECSPQYYFSCRSGQSASCQDRIAQSAILSYCAPYSDLGPYFQWPTMNQQKDNKDGEVHPSHPMIALTVLRHPVGRVWSMFRFQTRGCFECRNLTDIYQTWDFQEDIESTIQKGHTSHDICRLQLQNHMVRNLLVDPSLPESTWLDQAKYTLLHSFTLVGLTEHLPETHEMLGRLVPWMAEENPFPAATKGNEDYSCPIPHANKSPTNNGCGPNGVHWDLPATPPKPVEQLILQHNQLDLQLYEFAVQLFDLQRQLYLPSQDGNEDNNTVHDKKSVKHQESKSSNDVTSYPDLQSLEGEQHEDEREDE